MLEKDNYKIDIDGDWSLNDLYEFPHAYNQVYAFVYSLSDKELLDNEKLYLTYSAYPWKGGYSVVNFYTHLYALIPKKNKPKINSIKYSSPGWIELALAIGVAISIKKIVKNVCDSAKYINSTYHEIYKDMQSRKLLSLEVKEAELRLDKENLKFLEESSEVFAKLLGFTELEKLKELSKNPLSTMKMLLAFYRRVRTLSEYESKGKLKF